MYKSSRKIERKKCRKKIPCSHFIEHIGFIINGSGDAGFEFISHWQRRAHRKRRQLALFTTAGPGSLQTGGRSSSPPAWRVRAPPLLAWRAAPPPAMRVRELPPPPSARQTHEHGRARHPRPPAWAWPALRCGMLSAAACSLRCAGRGRRRRSGSCGHEEELEEEAAMAVASADLRGWLTRAPGRSGDGSRESSARDYRRAGSTGRCNVARDPTVEF